MIAIAPGHTSGIQRFHGSFACPICGGSDDDPRGQERRCWGYLSSDGEYAHCMREEHSGGLPTHPGSGGYAHKLKGACKCGTEHAPADPPARQPKPKRPKKNEAYYHYKDESATLLFQAIRQRYIDTGEKTFTQRRPSGDGKWVYNLKGVRTVLYRLPELVKADSKKPVFFVEGEKDVDRLRAQGLIATCNPMGAGKWREEYAPSLRGRLVIIIPDNDKPGREHAEDVGRGLHGIAAEVKIVELPGLAQGGDVSDYLDHHTRDELIELAKSAPAWSPVEVEAPGDHGSPVEASGDRGGIGKDGLGARNLDRIELRKLTDWANAERVVHFYGHIVRYCYDWGTWLIFDGKRWAVDRNGEIYRLAKRAIALSYAEIEHAPGKEEKKALFGWLLGSENKKRLDSMIELTKKQERISIGSSDLDKNQWLLNVENCTIDLRTGEAKPHQRRDLITKIAPVEYHEDAPCPVWEATIETVMGKNPDLMSFLRRAAGYAITGDVGEQCLFFLYGSGANGKTTVLTQIEEILGDYACTIRSELLTVKKQQEHTTELCDLEGMRCVNTIEIEDGKRLAEALVKSLTGGDKIRARRMRCDPYQFSPTFKLFIAANHKPVIRGTDHGIWRRINLIPFSVTIPAERQDKNLPDKLRAERSGILAWMVRGCLEWQRDGLQVPEAVVNATAEYRADMDTLGDFIEERCEKGDECRANDLYKSYVKWCASNGNQHPLSMKRFGSELNDRGFKTDKRRDGIWRIGIKPLPDPYLEAAVIWLDEYLSNGPAKVGKILSMAEIAGHGKEFIFAAKDMLSVEDFEDGTVKHWRKTTPF